MTARRTRFFVGSLVFGGLAALTGACAAAPSDTAVQTSEPIVTPDPTPRPASTPSAPLSVVTPSEPAPTAPDVERPPYPEDPIHRAQASVLKTCANLVYKNGCSELRTGTVSVRVSLHEDGSVLSAHTSGNTVTTDPATMENCILDAVEKFTFDAPGASSPSFTIKFTLSDKC
jgi:hypothetical protein